MSSFRGLLFFTCLLIAGVLSPAVIVAADLTLTVVTNTPDHFSWQAADYLSRQAKRHGLQVRPQQAGKPGTKTPKQNAPDLLLMPVRSLATQVPALEILELPFLFDDLDAVHRAMDAELGKLLRKQARQRGWQMLALWDEGLHVLSGNRRYDRVINLTGMEFILLRPDPVAQRQFTAFDAWTREARPQSREQLLRECIIGSRAATLQQIWLERLDRVHMDLSLSRHRYEGWVLIAPAANWDKRPAKQKTKLNQAIAATTRWQYKDTEQREARALQQLKDSGMYIHTLTAEQKRAFRKRLPDWQALLSDTIEPALRQRLITAATIRVVDRPPGKAPLPQAQPKTPGR